MLARTLPIFWAKNFSRTIAKKPEIIDARLARPTRSELPM